MIALFLGGANSGKSRAAELRAAQLGAELTYLATWRRRSGAPDPEMEGRVARHRTRRPSTWSVRELRDGEALGDVLRGLRGPVLVDALGTWVAAAPGFEVDVADLCAALGFRDGSTIVVSDEVGMGVHPSTTVGRAFREAMGPLNEAVASIADEAWLVVAGRLLSLHPSPWEN